MFEQMCYDLLLGILRATPEIRRTANIETRDSPIMGDHNLALGEAEPQCAHETKTLRGMSRPHLHRLRHGLTGTEHRGDHFFSRHIDCRLLPRWGRLK